MAQEDAAINGAVAQEEAAINGAAAPLLADAAVASPVEVDMQYTRAEASAVNQQGVPLAVAPSDPSATSAPLVVADVVADVVASVVIHSQKSDLGDGAVSVVAMDAEAVTSKEDHAREDRQNAGGLSDGADGARDVSKSKPDRASLAQALTLPVLHADSEKDRELLVIDAARVSNVARFINHSCSPNLTTQPVFAKRARNTLLYYVGLFATQVTGGRRSTIRG